MKEKDPVATKKKTALDKIFDDDDIFSATSIKTSKPSATNPASKKTEDKSKAKIIDGE